MAFYPNAFKKLFIGNGSTITNTTVDYMVTQPGLNLGQIANLGSGYIAVIDPNTYLSVNPSTYTGTTFILANTSPFKYDKYGMNGGYKMCDLTKVVNKNYAYEAYYADVNNGLQHVIGIGTTDSSQTGCTPTFYCGQDYFLRIDVKGSPILKAFVHNLYRTLHVNTGCCTGGTPQVIDPTFVFIDFAKAIVEDPYLSQFVYPVVYSNGMNTNGINYIVPPSYNIPKPTIVTATTDWTSYTVPNTSANAGLILIGTYVDTMYGNCSYDAADDYDYEPIKLIAQFVDMTGNPCESLNYCRTELQQTYQGNGYGSNVQKEYLESMALTQSFLSDDIRIREAGGTADLLIDRTLKYYRYGFLHTVPRFMGHVTALGGVFNSDRYHIEIATPLQPSTGNGSDILNSFLLSIFGTINTSYGTYTVMPITIS